MNSEKPTRIRHVVLLLTVAAYMITYFDRVLMGSAMPSIQKEMGFSLVTMGWILSCYQVAYAVFQIPGGWLGDRFGARRALAGVVVWWSVFTALIPFSWSVFSLGACLFVFGAGEAGAFPIATRSLARWMLPSERGLAQGATHAGSRLGGAITPVVVVYLIGHYGWRFPFYVFAGLGLVWASVWFWYYRDSPVNHPRVNQAERDKITGALGNMPARVHVPWLTLLASRQLWLLSAVYFCYGYTVVLFLSWFPKYLADARGFNLAQMGFFASLPLLAGFTGDLTGGIVSDYLVKRTGALRFSRGLVSVLGFGLAAIAIPLGCLSADPMAGVALFCAAVFGLELTVGISWAITLDVGGGAAGSVSAFMNTWGNLGSTLSLIVTGYVAAHAGWNAAFYVLAAVSLLAALLMTGVDPTRRLNV